MLCVGEGTDPGIPTVLRVVRVPAVGPWCTVEYAPTHLSNGRNRAEQAVTLRVRLYMMKREL